MEDRPRAWLGHFAKKQTKTSREADVTYRYVILKRTISDRIAAGIVSLGYEKENRQETHIHSARRFGRSGGAGRRRSHAPADPEAEFDNRLRRSSLAISFGGSGKEPSRMQVHIKSEATPIPEGLSRTIDKYNKIILPYNAPSGGKEER
ncbi:MAG: hypothetical protein K2K83_03325 [Rikenella sp.]|nr:hypothetical protein [Rikenella sp.]